MGAILDVRDQNLMRRVAMKVMKNPEHASTNQLARFIEEAQITGQLQHPGIVPVHELAIDKNNRPFYTMKLLKGKTLEEILNEIKDGNADTRSAWSLTRLTNAFARVCEAIQYAHSKNVIHRDLKPENIMTGAFGEVQVLDWGLAKVLERQTRTTPPPHEGSIINSVRANDDSEQFASMDGTIAGTPAFMAPEQAAGKIDQLDQRTDVYALGAILYCILTLTRPIAAPTTNALLSAVRKGEISLPNRNPNASFHHCPNGIPPNALCAIAMKALSRNPEHRYQTTGQLLQDIEAYQGGFATAAEDASAIKKIILFTRRHKLAATFSFLLASAILMGATISFIQARRATAALALAQNEEEKRLSAERESAASRLKAARVLIREGDYRNAEQS